ncbi:MAG: hypothetical protein KJ706_08690 [Candidatus Omnitrophica bacterium]|nr:hypothetical protein [Candidatus Omnitrophota bacterium]
MIVLSERKGIAAIKKEGEKYIIEIPGKCLGKLTKSEWDSLVNVGHKTKFIYYLTTRYPDIKNVINEKVWKEWAEKFYLLIQSADRKDKIKAK